MLTRKPEFEVHNAARPSLREFGSEGLHVVSSRPTPVRIIVAPVDTVGSVATWESREKDAVNNRRRGRGQGCVVGIHRDGQLQSCERVERARHSSTEAAREATRELTEAKIVDSRLVPCELSA